MEEHELLETEEDDDEEFFETFSFPPTIDNVLDQKSLQMIFVGGKGGVGKTSISCGLSVMLSKVRESVLLVSTDPAHNLSDAFNQKIRDNPTKIVGLENLYAMELKPNMRKSAPSDVSEFGSMIMDLSEAFPGIDEISGLLEVFHQLERLDFSCVVFDTAPTGHTLRLLGLPTLLKKNIEMMTKMGGLGPLMRNIGDAMGVGDVSSSSEERIHFFKEMQETLQDPNRTTFVCVCIPEFLSLYETERLVQELASSRIDTHNVVVNQVLYPDSDCICTQCNARARLQKVYLDKIDMLYEDFHVIRVPLLTEEVRGLKRIEAFGGLLREPRNAPTISSGDDHGEKKMVDA
eukprot:TRINITY_DN2310_c0_g1_i1.p1 TRINITY_DN2310_c0_g1~~TRINITY_DN2310_c0_g1_i1.p1  ORF type:complete len:347 (-),score=89.85 TRINITY_DN2310_c0_g1_i1:1008-2048(-)